MVKSYQKQNFSSLITYQTKENKIKRINKANHTCLFETPRFNYFGTGTLCQKQLHKSEVKWILPWELWEDSVEEELLSV